jgi:glycosyltransferase involved in cell wall biosynthesis
MPAVTVLVPTYEHAATLPVSVGSALGQTFGDLEVLIVGDGPTDEVRAAVADLEARDPRVRFREYPKGPKHGLGNRHAALEHAGGEAICYLADDDLWLPTHLEVMRELLAGAEFVHGLPVRVAPDGSLRIRPLDLSQPGQVERILAEGRNVFRLSAVGHSLAAYRGLVRGWGGGSYRRLWEEFLRAPGVRTASALVPTVLQFPSAKRDVPPERRVAELREWGERLAEPTGYARWMEELLADQVRHSASKGLGRGAGRAAPGP